MIDIRRLFCAAATIGVLVASAPAIAQPGPGGGPGGGPGMMGPGWGMGRGMMMGPGNWTRGSMRSFCNPQVAGFGAWRLEQIEQIVKPDDSQRKAFDDLRAASDKAAKSLSGACPDDVPQTMSARLAFMETRMSAMLDAIKTVRPAFDAFYATLSSEQKAKLDSSRPRRWGWHRWRQNER